MFYIALWFSKIIVVLINIIDKKRGTNMSGKIACKMCKAFISHFKNIDLNKVIMITGTNGKSGTTNLIAHTIKSSGSEVAINTEGANMITGIATTLIKNSNFLGRFKKEYIILEIDERSFPAIHKFLPAKHICITNIQKDQVQRNGEPDFIYQKIAKAINKDSNVYLNNEEVKSKALEDLTNNVVYYSLEENSESFKRNGFHDVTFPCPKCNNKIEYEYYNMASIGKFKCTSCDYSSGSNIRFRAINIDYNKKEFECDGNKYKVNHLAPFYIYNYTLAIALCTELGMSYEDISKAFETFTNPADRKDILNYKGRNITYLVMKQENPETLQSSLDIISRDKEPKAIFIGPHLIENFTPYTNTFYLFDCNFDGVKEANVEKYIAFTDVVSYDTANRMIYGGIPEEKIKVLDTFNMEIVLKELEDIETKNIYILTNWYSREIIKTFIEKNG